LYSLDTFVMLYRKNKLFIFIIKFPSVSIIKLEDIGPLSNFTVDIITDFFQETINNNNINIL